MLTVRKTLSDEVEDAHVLSLEIQRGDVRVSLLQNGKLNTIECSEREWIEFIAGTFDIERMADQLGLSRLFQQHVSARPNYSE